MRILLAAIFALLSLFPIEGEDELLKAIVTLTGAADIEEIDESEAERYSAFAARPLRINAASRSRLIASGLLTSYQIASIYDYRGRSGDILSEAELALVDGFGEETAKALALFVSFEPAVLPGQTPSGRRSSSHEWILRTAWKDSWSSGLKYRYVYGDRFEAAFAGRSAYGDRLFPPSAYTFHAVYYGSGHLGKIIVGDFNARFGQGLALWGGFSMSSLSSLSAFVRRPALVTPVWSYTGSGTFRGVAADMQFGRFVLSAFASVPGLKALMEPGRDKGLGLQPGMNLSWYGREGQAGVTACLTASSAGLSDAKMSADARWNFRGTEVFGEAAFSWLSKSGAVRGGTFFAVGDGVRLAFLVRVIPSAYSGRKNGEHAASSGVEFSAGQYVVLAGKTGFGSSVKRHTGSLTLDAALLPVPGGDTRRRQFRSVASWAWQIAPSWSLAVRISERLRTYDVRNRTDVRADLGWSDGLWSVRFRGNAVFSEKAGWLGYAEAGYQSDRMSAYLKGTVFHADSWNDRIYSYERDAPGNFSVPAYYGRGYSFNAVGGIRRRVGSVRFRFYLRASCLGYFPPDSKPSRLELKAQVMIDFGTSSK